MHWRHLVYYQLLMCVVQFGSYLYWNFSLEGVIVAGGR
jgi:hypothetical protein